MQISIINGPNLNLIGSREPEVYGGQSLDTYLDDLATHYPAVSLSIFQSNIEGEIINEIHRRSAADGIIINAGAYTHTSIAIADALKAIACKNIIEVHISNVYARESFRRESYIAAVCRGSISGLGLKGYALALEALLG